MNRFVIFALIGCSQAKPDIDQPATTPATVPAPNPTPPPSTQVDRADILDARAACTRTGDDGSTATYDEHGWIVSQVVDGGTNTTLYTRAGGRVTHAEHTSSTGVITSLTFDERENPLRVTSNGDVLQDCVITYEGSTLEAEAQCITPNGAQTLGYDACGELVDFASDALGYGFDIEYGSGCVRVSMSLSFDGDVVSTTLFDELGRESSYVFNAFEGPESTFYTWTCD